MNEVDVEKIKQITDLSLVPKELRDLMWEQNFLQIITTVPMSCPAGEVLKGPDGFSYLILRNPPTDKPFENRSLSNVLGYCLKKGLGIVVNPNGAHDNTWVFSYGNLWSLQRFGTFQIQDPGKKSNSQSNLAVIENIEPNGDLGVGDPSEEFFPEFARINLRLFLKSLPTFKSRIENILPFIPKKYLPSFIKELSFLKGRKPKVFAMHVDGEDSIAQLVFNFYREDFKNFEEFRSITFRLQWYLPPHYKVNFIDSKSSLSEYFFSL
jgi:hypothetical protein